MTRLIDADALVDALMMHTWYDEDGWVIDDAEAKREYIKGWLPDIPTVSGWISVNDRLPEFEGDYLVTDGHRVPWKCRMIKIGGTKGWVNNALNPVVKYWMPLPEPPKEDNDAEQ